jgi:hypothetical protein
MFTQGQTIKINGKKFTIVSIDTLIDNKVNLVGTLEGDPSFLAGKRTVYAPELSQVKTGFKYSW